MLDIGCGTGTDLLLACQAHWTSRPRDWRRHDRCDARNEALAGANAAGLTNVDVFDGDADALPFGDASVDIVISNGVLNVVPDKRSAVREMARVLEPGGRAQIADIVIGAKSFPTRSRHRSVDRLIAGALLEAEPRRGVWSAGFTGTLHVLDRSIASPAQRRNVPPSGTANVGVNLTASDRDRTRPSNLHHRSHHDLPTRSTTSTTDAPRTCSAAAPRSVVSPSSMHEPMMRTRT